MDESTRFEAEARIKRVLRVCFLVEEESFLTRYPRGRCFSKSGPNHEFMSPDEVLLFFS